MTNNDTTHDITETDLAIVLSDEVRAKIEKEHYICFSAGDTIADVIRSGTAIGYGGHYFEASDEEEDLLYFLAATYGLPVPELLQIRYCFTQRLYDAHTAAEQGI